MVLSVTLNEIVATVHILAVVVAFGGALVYPVWFRLIRDGTDEQRSFFHRAQATLGKFVITPGIVLLFATGAYLASDLDLWGEAWVLIPTAITVVILVLGAGLLGPSEDRLAEHAAEGEQREYETVLGRVKAVTWLLAVLVVAATFLMVARVPDGGETSDEGEGASPGAEIFAEVGCGSCHTFAAAGTEGAGGPNLDEAAAGMTPQEVAAAVGAHPDGFEDQLSEQQLEDLAGFVAESADSAN